MTADCSRLLVWHRKMNVLQTLDACAAVRIVDCWWSADEDVRSCRLMRWRSFADEMELVHTTDKTVGQTVFSSPHYIGDWVILSSPVCGIYRFANKTYLQIGNWVETRQTLFTPHFETGQNSIEIYCRRQSWLVANCAHTADTDKTRIT